MGLAQGAIACLAYILGLLATGVWWGGWVVLIGGLACAVTIPRYWRKAPRPRFWLIAGVIGLLASLYFQFRLPQPSATDISRLIPSDGQSRVTLTVVGEVDSLPRLTRSQKAQIWLTVKGVEAVEKAPLPIDETKPVDGTLYVTLPLAEAIELHPGQQVKLTGSLYKPKAAANPGGFDFQKYLQQEDCFAGFSGKQVELLPQPTHWGWWMVQQRIVRSQSQWLGSPAGPLVSSMVLGSRGVDLPFDLKDQFTQVGLAHALAASGFQTSLILGVVLALSRRLSTRLQFILGSLSLLLFVGLTGIQPAVLRAALMGFGGLVALLLTRKLNPLGALLVTATLLLLYNPIWIWNLGFQLSFLATLGLLVTVPALTKRMEWLPGGLIPLLAVPLAAYLWTLPLQLFAFGVLSPYTVPVNLVTTPLISLISLGGMASALAALVWSPAGSALAWLLKYPTLALIAVVDYFAHLPGNAFAVGTISAVSAIALYCLVGLTWLQPWWRRRWWLAIALGVCIVVVPVGYARATLLQVTVLATPNHAVMVLQDGSKTALVNSGDESVANFSILPFLQKQGVNELHWAIATDPTTLATGWQTVLQRLPARSLYATHHVTSAPSPPASPSQNPLPLPWEQPAQLGNVRLRQLHPNAAAIELQFKDQTWLFVDSPATNPSSDWFNQTNLSPAQVIWWSGDRLPLEVLEQVQPKVAIASSNRINPDTLVQLRQRNIQLFWTGRDGAIQWTPNTGFRTTLESGDNGSLPL
jgi:competence protein ComEC